MPDDNRLNFDEGDLGSVRDNLAKDIAEATRMAKARQDADKAKDKARATKGRDKTLMMAIVILAAIALFALAWVRSDRNQAPAAASGSHAPVTSSATTQTAPYRQAPPQYNRPRPVQPPSEPVRRTPTDTYEQGPGHAGGM